VLDDPRETAQGESLLAESLLTESLIEDVPIHGMCGVY
jgi:mycofactocin precursor